MWNANKLFQNEAFLVYKYAGDKTQNNQREKQERILSQMMCTYLWYKLSMIYS